jgi:UDP-N-acetylmuramoyl-tripeptide--D-alanyl-D-alanine ligase
VKWILEELIAGTDARVVSGDARARIDGASVDSRTQVVGRLFVGLEGDADDGGNYAPVAFGRGAAAALVGASAWGVISEQATREGWTVVVSPDPLGALQEAGRRALARSGATVVGITGSVGKTTTKDILVAMLRAAGVTVHGTAGNQNTEVGVPLSLLDLSEHTQVAVVEMAMRGTGQIDELVGLAAPHVACITAIAPVHLELLESVEAIAGAKAEILARLVAGDVAVVPAREPLLTPFLDALAPGVEVRTFDQLPDWVNITLTKAWQQRDAAAAWECCVALGHVPPDGAVIDVALSAMRGQERGLAGGGVLIEDCYNANPVAMRAALRDLAGRGGRRVAVLGDMMELGPDEARFHREVGELVAELGIDFLVAVGPRAADYVVGAAGVSAVRFADSRDAANGIVGVLVPGDTVLVKASRSVALERVCEVLV